MAMTNEKTKRPQRVFTLLVQVGRKPDDGLPDGATGAGLLCYSSGVDEAELMTYGMRTSAASRATIRSAPGRAILRNPIGAIPIGAE